MTLEDWDRNLTLSINGWGCEAFDPIMLFVSKVPVWIWLYALVGGILLWKMGWRKALLAIAALALTCLLTDQLTNILKNGTERFRPCEDPLLEGLIRPVAGHSSLYGFPSGHAANTFGFALLSSLLIRRRFYTVAITLWASLISYSRIYLGKHFLGDIITGIAVGIAIGYCIYLIYKYIERRCFA